ncbi:uncharacterized protein LOC128721528 [Anopheles nili]|uniref:uncharacterized protein LOC128721528 n=1 Tax=Anopheles nili TaxID=185578 RepID=UPI00237B44CC|nr:uncharacterized protein LOC128721528 [Anopheles nili]
MSDQEDNKEMKKRIKEPKRKKTSKVEPNDKKPAKKDKALKTYHFQLKPMVHQLIGNPNRTYQWRHQHDNILQLPLQPNVIDADTLLTYFECKRPYITDFAVPLHKTPGTGPTCPDLMLRALSVKENYHRELQSLEAKYHRTVSNYPLDPNADESVQYSAAVIYTALLEKDPDRFLITNTGYDYYFTGGAMATVGPIVGDGVKGTLATMFKAVGESLEDVEVLWLGSLAAESARSESLEVLQVQPCSTEIPGPILEIVTDESGTFVLVRKRNNIVVLRGKPAEDAAAPAMVWRPVAQIFSSISLASVCIVSVASCGLSSENLTLCVTDYRRKLQLWTTHTDQDDQRCIDVVKLPNKHLRSMESTVRLTNVKEDNWSAVRCMNQGTLVVCLDRLKLHLYAVQRNPSTKSPVRDECIDTKPLDELQLVYSGGGDFSKWILECERCCALEIVPAESLLLVATWHKLLIVKLTDTSCSGSKPTKQTSIFSVNVLLVFAHHLQQHPVFISHQSFESKCSDQQHFVLVASHLPMSYGLICFNKSYGSASSSSGHHQSSDEPTQYNARLYPYHPKTFHETYRLAQTKGHCLSAYEPLRTRFYACQSGAVLLRGAHGTRTELHMHVLLQTSAGDLVRQHVSFSVDKTGKPIDVREDKALDQLERDVAVETLRQWHETLVKEVRRVPYRATDFRTMEKFRNILNCPIAACELKKSIFLPPINKNMKKQWAPGPNNNTDGGDVGEEPNEEADDDALDDRASFQSMSSSRSSEIKASTPRPWQQTVDELKQYRDLLAPAMLKVWLAGNYVADSVEQIPTKLPPYANAHERVESWVNAANGPPMPFETEETNDAASGQNMQSEYDEPCMKKPKTMPTPVEEQLTQASTATHPIFDSQLSHESKQKPISKRPTRKSFMKGF